MGVVESTTLALYCHYKEIRQRYITKYVHGKVNELYTCMYIRMLQTIVICRNNEN